MRERTYEIKIEGVPIIVTKKRMKNMYLRIKKEDGMVLISAPYQMSDLRIRRFAEERLPHLPENGSNGYGNISRNTKKPESAVRKTGNWMRRKLHAERNS